MSNRLQDNLDFLRVLAKCNKKQRQALLEHGNNELLKCICELSLNVLNGAFPLTEDELKRLRRFKLLLRTLIDKKIPLKQKKKHLIQRGGNLLSYLLPP